MIVSEVLNITTTSVLEQISSKERAQVERRKIIGSNSFETTWTTCFHILIYTWRGRRKGKVFLLKQCQQTGPWCSHTLFSYYCLPLSVGQKWHFAGLIPRKKLPPSRGISLNTLAAATWRSLSFSSYPFPKGGQEPVLARLEEYSWREYRNKWKSASIL